MICTIFSIFTENTTQPFKTRNSEGRGFANMSLKLVIILLSAPGGGHRFLGYFLRWTLSLPQKRGPSGAEIVKMMLEAKEEAKKITAKAEKDAEKIKDEKLGELKEREGQAKRPEDRLIKKEELLDKRQGDIDNEVEKTG